jgi:enediyne biosynthesis protein E4
MLVARAGGLAAALLAAAPLGFSFREVAVPSGLDAVTVFGGRETNRYLLETTGCGAAFLDYDDDGWLDVCLVNGTTLEGFPPGKEPINHLYRNKGDGTFEDVTRKAGLAESGWGQGVCAGDYDNDGRPDLYFSQARTPNRLCHNDGPQPGGGWRFSETTTTAVSTSS